MQKFRLILGILLILISPVLLWIGLDAQQNGIDLAQPDGSRGAALFDSLGAWGLAAVFLIMGIVEVRRGLRPSKPS